MINCSCIEAAYIFIRHVRKCITYKMHSLILEMVANPAFDSVIPNITTAVAAPEKLKAEFTNPLYDENESLSKSFVVVYPI